MKRYLLHKFLLTIVAISGLCFLSAPDALAQVSARSEVSPQSGDTDEIFTFSVVIEGARGAAAPRLSDSQDFDVRYVGPNSFVSIINGSITARTSHIFQMTPRREGDLLTPSARVTVEGQSIDLPPLRVHVSKVTPQKAGDSKPGESEIIFRQSATPSSAYEGQQIINILDLYTSVSLPEIAPFDLATDGFWQEPISEGDRAQRTVNGRQYETIQIVKALYPLASGKLIIPSRLFRGKAARQVRHRSANTFNPFDPFSNDIFDSFLQRVEYEDLSLRSNQIVLDIKPLPPAPADIQPLLGPATLVGDTTLAVDSDVSIARVGDSKTITYHVASEGNLNPLTELTITTPEGLKVYPERPETKRERRGGKLVLHRYFPFSIVPLKPGYIKIPPVRLAYFNHESSSYGIASSKEVAFSVQGEPLVRDSGGAQPSHGLSSSPVPTLPPLPIAPNLEYEDATPLERALEAVSLKSAVLIASVLLALWLLLALSARLRPTASPEGLSVADLAKVGSLPELERFLRALATSRIPSLREDASFDEIRAKVAIVVKDQETALSIRSVFDELELLRYGSSVSADADSIARLKQRAQALLRGWR